MIVPLAGTAYVTSPNMVVAMASWICLMQAPTTLPATSRLNLRWDVPRHTSLSCDPAEKEFAVKFGRDPF